MPGLFDQAAVSQVQQANDIVDVISEHLSLKKKGREMVGVCPFHDDHRTSQSRYSSALHVVQAVTYSNSFKCGKISLSPRQ
jgi:DNA primase